ncbi:MULTISPECIES: lysine biosynthesis protein LysW [Streptomyces]|uniref:Lysine biosynthesis protein LysW n=2 Tax=Streptomyces TaxID=1883 RepID=A0A1Z2LDD7_9ACTN|nr:MULTISPECIES: lysine biosynthesis protein LysW [Streptomyces]ARZ72285.1 lysine biosynthesis protein LysW [Streptomyces albireticuli]MBB5120357.1 alpha-aminoadipate carrier protein LysW [Streptomyces eurocidicus]MBF6055971.1 lysine biosynthesis protein LysW [Streptomyces eurocidicus]MBT2385821.1 lysine biosynthesis protein LysW [Streptomyces sp. ISL-11]MCD9196223.1 lysine biosynthesis protein LysW [Streptomyces albireticuli]
MVICPECESSVALAEPPKVNEIIECGDCSSELEVLTVDPLQVALAPDVEEDWGE